MKQKCLIYVIFDVLGALGSAALQYLRNRSPGFKSKKGKGRSKEEEPSSSEANNTEDAEDKSSSRRLEDRYDLEDICAAAIEVSEDSQGLFDLLKKDSSRSRERDVFMFSQPVSKSKVLSEKVEEMEGVQALERDRLVSMNKMIETRIGKFDKVFSEPVLFCLPGVPIRTAQNRSEPLRTAQNLIRTTQNGSELIRI